MRAFFLALWITSTLTELSAQTQLDLRTQSKSVDFSGALSTKPFQTGGVLPPTCGVGQMFFVTTAPGGQNTFGCTAPNVWTLESGISPTLVKSAGVPVGSRGSLDLSTGSGVLWSISDTGQEVAVQVMLDTSLAQTKSAQQSGAALLCASPDGSASSASSYSCSMMPTVTGYSTGMVVNWRPDINGSGGATTLNIDSLGARPVKKADGVADPVAGDIAAGQLYSVWYDGTAFRLPGGTAAVRSSMKAGGYYFPFGSPTDNGSTGFYSAEVVKMHMFVPAKDMTLGTLSYYVNSASGCASATPCGVVFGIYDLAGNLLTQQAGVVTGTGAATLSFNMPVTLSEGTPYYLAWSSDSPTVFLQSADSGSWLFWQLLNLGSTVRTGTAANAATGTGLTLALPAVSGQLTAQGGGFALPPAIGFLF